MPSQGTSEREQMGGVRRTRRSGHTDRRADASLGGWSDPTISQGCPQPTELPRSSLSSPRGRPPCGHLDFGLWSQNSQKVNACCSKLPWLLSFVGAALGKGASGRHPARRKPRCCPHDVGQGSRSLSVRPRAVWGVSPSRVPGADPEQSGWRPSVGPSAPPPC